MTFFSRNQPDFAALTASIASGVLLTLAFPNLAIWPLVLIGLAPLVLIIRNKRPKAAFGYGFLTGFVHAASLLYWIVYTLVVYGYIPWAAALPIYLLFMGYLALYPALFAFGLALARDRWGIRPNGAGWVLLGSALYTALEYFKGWFGTGFPWEPLGSAFAASTPMVQLADVIGSGGLTFLVVMVNLCVVAMIRAWKLGRIKRSMGPATVVVCILALLFVYGRIRLDQLDAGLSEAEMRKAAMAQGNIDQSVKWDPANEAATLSVYYDLTMTAVSENPWLTIWPETAAPFFYQKDARNTLWLNDLARNAGTPILFGAPAYEDESDGRRFYNRAYLVDAEGRLLGHYDKVHLVPYGEYVPFQKYFPFIKKLTEATGDYGPGQIGRILELNGDKIGVLICYESIFPSLARRQIASGANFLVVITNDSWFGQTSAPYQHFDMAVMRAVEMRRTVFRAANTGISGVIWPTGRTVETTPLMQRAVLIGQGPRMTGQTIYARTGDVIPMICLIPVIILFGSVLIRRKKHVRRSKTSR